MLPDLRQNSAPWWDAWFAEWERWVVPRAARAEANGVSMFAPFVWIDFTLPDVYPAYDRRWREIIGRIREVYSGDVAGWALTAVDDRLTFLDTLDAMILTVNGGYYPHAEDGLTEVKNPTIEEAVAITERIFDRSQPLLDGVLNVYYAFGFVSADGQRTSEDIGERATFQVDFREQALYYEAFFKAPSGRDLDRRGVRRAHGLVRPVPPPSRGVLLRRDARVLTSQQAGGAGVQAVVHRVTSAHETPAGSCMLHLVDRVDMLCSRAEGPNRSRVRPKL